MIEMIPQQEERETCNPDSSDPCSSWLSIPYFAAFIIVVFFVVGWVGKAGYCGGGMTVHAFNALKGGSRTSDSRHHSGSLQLWREGALSLTMQTRPHPTTTHLRSCSTCSWRPSLRRMRGTQRCPSGSSPPTCWTSLCGPGETFDQGIQGSLWLNSRAFVLLPHMLLAACHIIHSKLHDRAGLGSPLLHTSQGGV